MYNNNIIIEEIIKCINRSICLFIDINYKIYEKKSSNNNNDNDNNKPPEYHIASNSKVQFKSNSNKNILSADQKTKLEKLITAKGGHFIELNIIRNKE